MKIITIGFGVGVSTYLINEVPKAGNGSCQHVLNASELIPAVISSLKQSLLPSFNDIEILHPEKLELAGPFMPFNSVYGNKINISGVFKSGNLPENLTH